MQTAINFIKRFSFDLGRSIYFAALSYDEKLQNTRTTSQRIFIWAVIAVAVIILAIIAVYFIWFLLDAFDVSKLG